MTPHTPPSAVQSPVETGNGYREEDLATIFSEAKGISRDHVVTGMAHFSIVSITAIVFVRNPAKGPGSETASAVWPTGRGKIRGTLGWGLC